MNLPPVTTPCGGTASSEKTHSAPTTDGGATAGGEFHGPTLSRSVGLVHGTAGHVVAVKHVGTRAVGDETAAPTFGHGAGATDEQAPNGQSPEGATDGSRGVAFEIPLKCGHHIKGVFSPAVHEEILRQDRAYCSVCDSVERIREGVK